MSKQTVKNKKERIVAPIKTTTIKSNFNYNYILLLVGILVLTVFVFSTSINNNFTNFDDEKYVTANDYIKELSVNRIKEIFKLYTIDELPITYLSFAIDYHFVGLNPLWYHIENLLWHLLNVILVYFLIRLLFKKDYLALFVALLFAIHPTRCESVAWVSERKDVLYTFFFLLSFILYLNYIRKRNAISYILCVVLFFVSILSKYAAVVLPFIFFAVDYYENRKFSWKTIVDKLPFFVICGISTYFHFTAPDVVTSNTIIITDYKYYDRIFFGSYAFIYYIVNSILPLKLSLIHPYPLKVNNILPIEYYISAGIALIIIGLLIWLFTKDFKHKEEYLFGMMLYLIPLSLVLHIVPFGGNIVVGERYSYISYIGLFIIFGRLLLSIYDMKPELKSWLIIFIILLTSYFSILTFNRNKVWKDSLTLWTDVVEKYPCVVAYNNLGTSKMVLKDFEGAVEEFNKAIAIKPDAYPYLSRGVSKINLNDLKGAIEDLSIGIMAAPNDYKAYDSRANAYVKSGDMKNALKDYDIVLKLKPDLVYAYNNRGIIKFNLSDYEGAILDYQKAIEFDPTFEGAYSNLGSAKGMIKDYVGSIDAFSMVIKLNNNNDKAYNYRAFSKFNLKDVKGACEDWNIAAKLGNQQSAQMIQTYCK